MDYFLTVSISPPIHQSEALMHVQRWAIGLALLCSWSPALIAQTTTDREGVRRAALDYLEGFYEGDSTKIIRSIRPELTKYGFYTRPGQTNYEGTAMSYAGAIEYANRVRDTGQGGPPENAPKEVQVLDVQNQTAAVKVTAWWGTDYLQLAKYDGRWMIVHVLWQTLPEGH